METAILRAAAQAPLTRLDREAGFCAPTRLRPRAPTPRTALLRRKAMALALALSVGAPASAQLLLGETVGSAPQASAMVGGQFLMIVPSDEAAGQPIAALDQRKFRLE